MKQYYLVDLIYRIEPLEDESRLTQLVYASSSESARETVRMAALSEFPDMDIFEIRCNETLIGE